MTDYGPQLHIRHGLTAETVRWFRREAMLREMTQGQLFEELVAKVRADA